MKNIKKIIFSICLLIVLNCTGQAQEVINLDLENNLEKNEVFNIAGVADVVNVIPLETKKECLLGDIEKVIKVGDLYLVIGQEKKLFVFNNTGRFIRQIGKQGRGPKEYLFLTDFTYSKKEKLVYVNSVGEILKYTIDGDFVEKCKLPNTFLQVLTITDKDKLAFISPVSPQNKAGQEFNLVSVFDSKLNIKKHIRTKVKAKVGCGMFNWIYSKGDNIYFKDEFSNDICLLNNNLEKRVIMNLGLDNLLFTPDIFNFNKKSEWGNYYRMKGMMDFNHFCLLRLQHGLTGGDYISVIYDKRNKNIILPSSKDGEKGIWWSGVCLKPINDCQESLILSVAAEDLLENNNLSDNRLKQVAQIIDEESNPVLVLASFKN